jgi:hypothetical protein
MRRAAAMIVVLTAVLLAADRPFAWGVQGHHLIARIALTRLTPDTHRAVATILGDEDFVAVSTWADEVRSARPETYNWHFVDIPFGETTYSASRDCPPTARGDCVVAEIARARQALRDATLPARPRSEALKYLIHFVGDLHQPLHTIDDHDRGGNDVKVQGDAGRTSNLHALWDSGVIQKRGLDEDAYLRFLIGDLQAHPLPATDDKVDVIRWVEDGHRIAAADAYHYPEFSVTAPPATAISLSDAYLKRAQADIDRQLEIGGVHLAALLNETLASHDRPMPR